MAEFGVGMRWVCLRCLRRGTQPACVLCGRETIDLASPGGRAALVARWSAGRAYETGLGVYSPRGVWRARGPRNIAIGVAEFCVVGGALMSVIQRPPDMPTSVLFAAVPITLVLGTAFAVPVMLAVVYLYGNVVRVLRLILGAAGPVVVGVLPFNRNSARVRFGIAAWVFGLLQRWLLPQIEPAEPEPAGPTRGGRLVEPAEVSVVLDESGWLWRADAVVPALQVAWDDGANGVVALDTGVAKWSLATGTRVEGATLPEWLDEPRARGKRFRRVFPAGTRVRVTGGESAAAVEFVA